MKLNIRNVAQVQSADICIDGLTVIAGRNNTGKSTIGKTLFAVFNSFYNIQEKVHDKRNRDIYAVCSQAIRNYMAHSSVKLDSGRNFQRTYLRVSSDIANGIMKSMDDGEQLNIDSIIIKSLKKFGIVVEEENAIEELEHNIENLVMSKLQVQDSKIIAEVVERYFKQVFNGQINSLDKLGEIANITLEIKGKTIEIDFDYNTCLAWDSQISIMHEAFFIDNPFALDVIDIENVYSEVIEESITQEHLVSKLASNYDDIMDGVFEAVIAKEKLGEIYALLEKAVAGTLVIKNNELGFVDAAHKTPVYLRNLSTGLKSFLIIKLLLEKGVLKEKDVLILDEPEVHLHPEWQLLYAEIVVLLQKQFDLSIVLTTHSSQFLEALDYYSQKHKINEKCHYYLASVDQGYSEFEDVTDNLQKIYSQMVTPSILLDQLKYELKKENDD